jgi:DNA-binding NtrC family response regulator
MPHSVLLVEDHRDTRELLLHYLKLRGIESIVCESAASALVEMRKHHPAVAVVDEGLPGTTGTELFKSMKSDPELRGIPVIFYSGYFDNDKVLGALRLGAADWLVKGVHGLDRLFKAIQTAAGRVGTN